ncbi:hypothetical protein E3J84_01445 [Candidatus Aerophobetes bacterium]|uniref:Glycosyl hydrolase family 4 C-terminal domain-containing protein n=1 Tax=Aerophobetes bacterium TaxID=2030807 RepID=A0A523S3V6_UNCAE|nr:MAG: hypothetical protein E3J84_01445 [Candidatus Aerophobetes bacterium]
MANVKISVIGAGSAVFSLNLIKDLCLTPNLKGSTISFMDTNEERLCTVYAICRRYADEMKTELKLEKTLHRRESLKNADFVINLALAAGHERLREGWSIAHKHGYRFGGSYHIVHDESFWVSFYQFKLFESIINDMLEICPDAWYIQLANPVLAGITCLARKYKKANIVGLCHGYAGIYHIAEVLGLKREGISFQIPGVNHFVWLTHFYYKGEDAYPILDNWIEKEALKYWEECSSSDEMGPKPVDIYKRFGVFPIGDTANPGGGTWPWWYHVNDETEKKWKENPRKWYNEYFIGGEEGIKEMAKVSKDTSIKLASIFPPEKSDEITVLLVESIACDIPRVLQVNIPNRDNFVPGLPQDLKLKSPHL